jgi:hypothetical protein
VLYTNKVRFKLKFTKLIRLKNDNNKTKTNNMGNMSYCRFRNTLYDLQDCANAIEMGEFTDEGIDSSELSALMEIRDLCEYFVENLSEEINEIYETFYNNK